MNRIRIFTIAAAVLAATVAVAQSGQAQGQAQAKDQEHAHERAAGHRIPTAEEQMKLLTGRLSLSADQQAKVKPILQELQEETEKVMRDESMSREQRMEQVRSCRYKADKEIREVLNEDQKRELDQLEREPHEELHGGVHG